MKTLILFYSLLFFSNVLYAQANVQLGFEHMMKTDVLELDKTYENDFGEKFTLKSFKYYISNIIFEDDSGRIYPATKDVFLIDELSPESKRIALNIPAGKYKSMHFTIGVDSAHSVDGVQEGSLDPYLGMFWTWNSGYVSAKLEGTSPVSSMPQKIFEYHIGGFRTGQNSLRTITIPLETDFSFENKNNTLISVKADVSKWFNAQHRLKIAQHAFVHTPGELAMKYADNYASMFSLIKLKRY